MERAPYVPGSLDRRSFAIEGCSFHVARSPTSRDVGFTGLGRDGDYVPDGAPEPIVLARLLAGLPGLAQAWTGYTAASESDLDRAEDVLLGAATRYLTINREVKGDAAIAARLIAAPRLPGLRRSIYLSHGFSLTIDLPVTGDATITHAAWGRPPGTFAETTLASLGASTARLDHDEITRRYALPAHLIEPFVAAAIIEKAAADVRVVDGT